MNRPLSTVILGGTYNPVHIGHLMLADEVRSAFGFERVIFVPAARPPHKEVAGDIPAEVRLAMLELAVRDFPGAVVEDCEVRRGAISYSIDTIEWVREHYSVEGKPGFVIGDDLVAGFPSWHEPARIAGEARLIVAHRERADRVPFAYPHEYVDNMLFPVSSTSVRERIAEGRPFRYLVPPAVYEYIVTNNVYDRID